jgi:hypothetical protein
MEEDFVDYPLADSLDKMILMHRDAHFSGSFDFMLDYYRKGGKGVCPDFDIKRLEELAAYEKNLGQNLSAVMLSGAEAEKVSEAKESYKKLRDLYEKPPGKNKNPLLIADLILAEEENPERELAAIVAAKETIVPALIELLRAETFYDPLFPGYGLAPNLAAESLKRIGDKRAIISLFESIGGNEFFDEDISLEAIKAIGEPAKTFLLKVLHGRPLNEDNERAAIALVQFKEDPEVAITCFRMLQEPDVLKDIPLSTYLILACEGLENTPYQEEFKALLKNAKLPKMLQKDIEAIIHAWERTG